jgi:hypothetical protein
VFSVRYTASCNRSKETYFSYLPLHIIRLSVTPDTLLHNGQIFCSNSGGYAVCKNNPNLIFVRNCEEETHAYKHRNRRHKFLTFIMSCHVLILRETTVKDFPAS